MMAPFAFVLVSCALATEFASGRRGESLAGEPFDSLSLSS
jgi:hypothetical protein